MGQAATGKTMDDDEKPSGELMLRTLTMPADTNPAGDIFGGWVLAQMDIAGGIAAAQATGGRVATVAVDSMSFHKPVFVGDVMCCYAAQVRTGTTSITFRIQAFVIRGAHSGVRVKVTEGLFTFVAIGDDRKPREIQPRAPSQAGS